MGRTRKGRYANARGRVVIIGGDPAGEPASRRRTSVPGHQLSSATGFGGARPCSPTVPRARPLIATVTICSASPAPDPVHDSSDEDGDAIVRHACGTCQRWVKSSESSISLLPRVATSLAGSMRGRRGAKPAWRGPPHRRPDGPRARATTSPTCPPTSFCSRPAPVPACRTAQPDGERILTWQQIHCPCRAARAPDRRRFRRHRRGSLRRPISAPGPGHARLQPRPGSPGEDTDAAAVIEDVFTKRGMTVLSLAHGSHRGRPRDTAGVATGSRCHP